MRMMMIMTMIVIVIMQMVMRQSMAMRMALKEAVPGRSLATLRALWWRPRFCMRLGSCLAGRWNALAAGLRSTRADWWVRWVPSPVPRS